MTTKKLPTSLTVKQVYDLAGWFTDDETTPYVPAFIQEATLTLRKKTAVGALAQAIREIVGEAEFEAATENSENPQAASIREQIACKEEEIKVLVNGGYTASFMATMAPLAKAKEELSEQLNKLNNVEGLVEAKLIELFGEIEFDYKVDTLVWGQQVTATQEAFGVEKLVLWPILGPAVKPFKEEDANKIAVIRDMEDNWQVVAILPTNGANSSFFKDVAALVGKENTSDGINAVTVYEGEGKPIVVGKDVIRK